MKNLPLNSLRAFAAVFEEGGVRPAARRLSVTHSSVSKFLSELETHLGVRLVNRMGSNRITGFTREGELLGKSVLASFSEIKQVIASIQESQRQNSVTIETTSAFAARWFFPRLGEFELAYPDIELSVVVDQRVKPPSEQDADITIRLGKGPWSGLDCRPFMDDALYPVMRQDYWEGFGKPAELTSLSKMRLLHDKNPQASWARWAAYHELTGLNLLQGPRYSTLDLALRAAEQGLGVALARHQFVKPALEAGLLIAPYDHAVMPLEDFIWLVRPGHGQPSKAARKVMDWLFSQAELDGALPS
ncbi:LysR substrate-binding domain-containing protein [Sneathiella limimaris]|uniref:LysR substrate-binding domain-containing protein n=1 Tax=Sneathiella limimaris TaxID=1964213 RepID=UPI00146D7FF0|nr:LysR substrate-binding domain-containing protein [Sneathiella limimaris]